MLSGFKLLVNFNDYIVFGRVYFNRDTAKEPKRNMKP